LPEHPIIHGDEGVDGALVSLAALETQRTCRLVRAIEVGGVGSNGRPSGAVLDKSDAGICLDIYLWGT
jgi:hypothetical protein